MIAHDPAEKVRCTGEFVPPGPNLIPIPAPEGEWLWTHTVGNFARLQQGEQTRAWPVDQLLRG